MRQDRKGFQFLNPKQQKKPQRPKDPFGRRSERSKGFCESGDSNSKFQKTNPKSQKQIPNLK